MSHGSMPRLFEFWQMLTAKFPGDLEQMRSGVVASERVLPPPAIALNLRTEDREAATGVAQGSDHDGRRSRQLSAVGPDCSAESVDNIRGREASTRRGISHHEARIYNERRELESLKGQLSRDGHKKDKAKELSDKIAAAESTIANAEAAIERMKRLSAECAALAAIEADAKLEGREGGLIMATNRQDQILRFLVQAEGTEALVPFIKTVKELEGASDETRKAADALLNQLAEAARLQTVATSYEAIEKAITGLAARAEAAKAKAAGLADELARTENPSKRQREAFDNAQASAGRLATQLASPHQVR